MDCFGGLLVWFALLSSLQAFAAASPCYGGNTIESCIAAQESSVSGLSVANLGLTGELPASVGGYTQLALIDTSSNQVSGFIPTEIGSLSNLLFFSIADNRVSGTLPAQLSNLTALRVFNVKGNRLEGEIRSPFASVLTGLDACQLGQLHPRFACPIPPAIVSACTPGLCTDECRRPPIIPAGYELDYEQNLTQSAFNVSVLCEATYVGQPMAVACSEGGMEYTVAGCRPNWICTTPAILAGYVVTETNLTFVGFTVEVACTIGERPGETPAAEACTGGAGTYTLSGCFTSNFQPADRAALRNAVKACILESPDGSGDCPTHRDSHGHIGDWDVSQVTDMGQAFYFYPKYGVRVDGTSYNNLQFASNFNQDTSGWDTARVTRMTEMFAYAGNFNADIGRWNVGKVTDMQGIFNRASQFNQDIGRWNVGQVTDMSNVFFAVTLFNADISGWDTAKVTQMSRMFDQAKSFNQDISSWDTARVETMDAMFSYAYAFNQPIGRWNVGKVTGMGSMFRCHKTLPEQCIFDQDLSSWDVSRATSNINQMFAWADRFNQPLASWDISSHNYLSATFLGARSFDQDLSAWDTSRVITFDSLFNNAWVFNQDIASWDVSKVTNMMNMFYHAYRMNQDLSAWNTASLTRCQNMWQKAGSMNFQFVTTCTSLPLPGNDFAQSLNLPNGAGQRSCKRPGDERWLPVVCGAGFRNTSDYTSTQSCGLCQDNAPPCCSYVEINATYTSVLNQTYTVMGINCTDVKLGMGCQRCLNHGEQCLAEDGVGGCLPNANLSMMSCLPLLERQPEWETCVGDPSGCLELQLQHDRGSKRVTGTIPAQQLGQLVNLTSISLPDEPDLSGTLPVQVGRLTQLSELDLAGTVKISGWLPVQLKDALGLTTLDLSFTRLSGSVPQQYGSMTNLVRLDFSSTELSDYIPVQVGLLVRLTELSLSFTLISGTIPTQVGHLQQLKALRMQGHASDTSPTHRLSGTIPTQLASLTHLTELVIPRHHLDGDIIDTARLVDLMRLDLSYNRLQGTVSVTVLRPQLMECSLRQQDDSIEDRRFLCWDTRSTPIKSIKCGFACGYERCSGVARFDPDLGSIATDYDIEGYSFAARSLVNGSSLSAVMEGVKTTQHFGSVTCEPGYGSYEHTSWVPEEWGQGPAAACSSNLTNGQFVLRGCDACPAGQVSDGITQPCGPCPDGLYADRVAAPLSACQKCPAGKTSSSSSLLNQTCEPCTSGQYADMPGLDSCRPCAGGTYNTGRGLDRCEPCSPGMFQPTVGLTTCLNATLGLYVSTPGRSEGQECSPGTFADQMGQSLCKSCIPGTFQPESGKTNCTAARVGYGVLNSRQSTQAPCEAGYYADVPGLSACESCPQGQHQPGSTSTACIPCDGGSRTVVSSTGQAAYTAATGCVPCIAGKFSADGQTGGECTTCGPGHKTNQQLTRCLACESGKYSEWEYANMSCVPCSIGTYVDFSGASGCKVCSVGQSQNQQGQASCSFCAAGQFQDRLGQTGCLDAPIGSHAPSRGSNESAPCPLGSFSDEVGRSACNDCGEGQYQNQAGTTACKPAEAGWYAPSVRMTLPEPCSRGKVQPDTSSRSCTDCPAGTYQGQRGQTQCDPARIGYFVPSVGSGNDTKCGGGRFTTEEGQAGCRQCDNGKYANPDSDGCNNCTAGTFGDAAGLPECKQCDPGKYQDELGQHECKECRAGTHMDSKNAASCRPCSNGTFAYTSGLKLCTDCPAGTFQSSEGRSECELSSNGSYVPNAGSTSQTPCPEGEYSTEPGQNACRGCFYTPYGPPYTTAGVGATTCDKCRERHYMILAGERYTKDTCVACQKGMECYCPDDAEDCPSGQVGLTLQNLPLQAGYHRATTITQATYIKACPHPGSCRGGALVGDAACKNGTKGPLCAVCESGYYMDEQTTDCIRCGDWTQPVINTVVLLAVLLVCIFGLYKQQHHIAQTLESMSKRSRSHLQFVLRSAIMPKVKIIVPFINVLSVLGWAYGADKILQVDAAERLLQYLDMLSVDLNGSIPIGCLTERTALLTLIVSTVPLIGLSVVVIAVVRLLEFRRVRWLASIKSLCYSGLVFLWLLTFPLVSGKIFKVLRGCDDFEDASYMKAAYNVDCDTQEYTNTLAYGYLAIAVYPIGVPLATLMALAPQRRKVKAYQSLQVHMRLVLQTIHAIEAELSRHKPDVPKRQALFKGGVSLTGGATDMIDEARQLLGDDASKTGQLVADGTKPLGRSVLLDQGRLRGYKLREALQQAVDQLRDAHVAMGDAAASLVGNGKHDDKLARSGWMALTFESYGYYSVWWWEVFENIRKLMLIGMVVIMSPNTTDRILIAIGVESLSFFLYGLMEPFRDNADNILSQACRGLTLAILLYVLAVDLEHVNPDSDRAQTNFAIAVLTAIVGLLGYATHSSNVALWVYAFFCFRKVQSPSQGQDQEDPQYSASPRHRQRKHLKSLLERMVSTDLVDANKPPRPIEPGLVTMALGKDGVKALEQLIGGKKDPSGSSTTSIQRANTANSIPSNLFSAFGRRFGASSNVMPAPRPMYPSVQKTSTDDSGLHTAQPGSDLMSTDVDVEARGSGTSTATNDWIQELIGETLNWVVDAAAASHFFHDTKHNLRELLTTEPFTLQCLTHSDFGKLRSMCAEKMAAIGEPLRLEVRARDHCRLAGSEAVQVSVQHLDEAGAAPVDDVMGKTKLKSTTKRYKALKTKTVELTTQERDEVKTLKRRLSRHKSASSLGGKVVDSTNLQVAQDNTGALATPVDWDWTTEDREKVWIHVLVLVALAIQDRFHEAVESCMQAVHGETFDGFSPGPTKRYARMVAGIRSAESRPEQAKPRANLHVDVVRCLVTIHELEDLQPTLTALSTQFGPFVKFENGYDLTDEEATERFHIRAVVCNVLFKPGETFGGLVNDPAVQERWSRYVAVPGFQDGEPNARRRSLVRRAVDYLQSDAISGAPVNMICEVQVMTRGVSHAHAQMSELRKIWRAPDRKVMFRESSKAAKPSPRTLLEAAQQGEYDIVEQLAKPASEKERKMAMDAAEESNHWETVAVLQKTFVTRMDVPAKIDTEISNNVQGAVQAVWKDRIEQFWPTVMFSYATGSRAGVDDPGAGPGLYLCATLILALDAAGIDSFSGLHVLPGQHWRTTYYDRLEGPRSQAKVMIVLLTRALYRSKACLDEVATALAQGLQLVPIRAEADLPPGAEQWPIDMWGDKKEDETDDHHQARIDKMLKKIKTVKKGLGSFNHLPPRGLFPDLVNVELARLIDLLVVKSQVLEPVKVFASMRFPNGKPLEEAFELKTQLAKSGIDLLIVRVAAGDSIHETVFETSMAKCVGFVVMGSATYGQDTGNDSSSHYEVVKWNEQYAQVWGPIIPVRLIGKDDEYMYDTGKKVFSKDALQIWWSNGEIVAQEIAFAVSKRIIRHRDVQGKTVGSVERLVEKAKSFLWQTAWIARSDESQNANSNSMDEISRASVADTAARPIPAPNAGHGGETMAKTELISTQQFAQARTQSSVNKRARSWKLRQQRESSAGSDQNASAGQADGPLLEDVAFQGEPITPSDTVLEDSRLPTDPKQTNHGDAGTHDPDLAVGHDVEDEAAKLEREIAELDAVIAAKHKKKEKRELRSNMQ